MDRVILTALVFLAIVLPLAASAQDYGQYVFDLELYDAVDSDRIVNSQNLNYSEGHALNSHLDVFLQVTLARNEGYSTDEFNQSLGQLVADSMGVVACTPDIHIFVELHYKRNQEERLWQESTTNQSKSLSISGKPRYSLARAAT